MFKTRQRTKKLNVVCDGTQKIVSRFVLSIVLHDCFDASSPKTVTLLLRRQWQTSLKLFHKKLEGGLLLAQFFRKPAKRRMCAAYPLIECSVPTFDAVVGPRSVVQNSLVHILPHHRVQRLTSNISAHRSNPRLNKVRQPLLKLVVDVVR